MERKTYIGRETTMEELLQERLISTRTFNCLHSQQLRTMGDVAAFADIPERLRDIKGFGRKSFAEMLPLYRAYYKAALLPDEGAGTAMPGQLFGDLFAQEEDDRRERAWSAAGGPTRRAMEEAYGRMTSAGDRVADELRKRFPTAEALHLAVTADLDRVTAVTKGLTAEEHIALRQRVADCLRRVTAAAGRAKEKDSDTLEKYRAAERELRQGLREFRYRDKVECLITPHARRFMQGVYEEKREGLSHRACNFLKQMVARFEPLAWLFDAPQETYQNLCPGRSMTKTLAEVYTFNLALKADFDRYWQIGEREIETHRLRRMVPSLDDAQCRFAIQHREKHGFYPMMYLLNRYMRTSEARRDRIYSEVHGMRGGKPRTHTEMARAMGLSRERVRTLATSGNQEVFGSPLMKSEDWKCYYGLFALPYLTAETEECVETARRERLGTWFQVTARLVALRGGRGYEVRRVGDVTVVVNRRMMPTMDFGKCAERLEQAKQARYTDDTRVSIRSCVGQDVKGEELTHALALAAYVARTAMGLEVNGRLEMEMRQNQVDVGAELQGFLEETGHPLTLDELFRRFKRKYPDHKYGSAEQLRRFLYRPHVRAIGKSSTYGLDTWSGVYYGNISDLVEKLLRESGRPMRLQEIARRVKERFPRTNANSVGTLISLDTKGRFRKVGKGLYCAAPPRNKEQSAAELR